MNRPALAFCLLLLTSTALAGDFWLEMPRYHFQPGEAASVRLLVGDSFQGLPWRKPASRVRRFVRYGPAADSSDLRPAPGPAPGPAPTDSLPTAVTFARPGTQMLLLQTQPAFTTLPADQFTAYLRQAGLDFALRLRQENGLAAQPGRETYQRCAKALVQVAGPATRADTAYRHPLGLPLELVPEQNPYLLTPDKALTVRVLRAGRAAPGALVQVWQRQPAGTATSHFSTRANQSGRVLLRLSGPGPYLLTVVDMVPAPKTLRDHADWQSTWASLTFAGPAAAAGRSNRGK